MSLGHGSGTMNRREGKTPDAKRGFSLVEILVVLGIIAFLTAAIVVIMPRIANTSKIAATRATIKKVDELLNDRINGFQRWIQTQNTLAGNNAPGLRRERGLCGTIQPKPAALPRILPAKFAFRTSFPQSFSEMATAPTYNSGPIIKP